jgi:hypothetical protein
MAAPAPGARTPMRSPRPRRPPSWSATTARIRARALRASGADAPDEGAAAGGAAFVAIWARPSARSACAARLEEHKGHILLAALTESFTRGPRLRG